MSNDFSFPPSQPIALNPQSGPNSANTVPRIRSPYQQLYNNPNHRSPPYHFPSPPHKKEPPQKSTRGRRGSKIKYLAPPSSSPPLGLRVGDSEQSRNSNNNNNICQKPSHKHLLGVRSGGKFKIYRFYCTVYATIIG